jgi:hypothetical protein
MYEFILAHWRESPPPRHLTVALLIYRTLHGDCLCVCFVLLQLHVVCCVVTMYVFMMLMSELTCGVQHSERDCDHVVFLYTYMGGIDKLTRNTWGYG